jgi:hypothetical protein
MASALWYLWLHTLKGSLIEKIRRLKQPKYIVPALIGSAYFALVFGPRLLLSGAVNREITSTFIQFIAAGLGFLYAMNWAFYVPESGLGFSRNEADILFSAPLTTRGLLFYNVMKTMPKTLFTSLIFSVVIRMNVQLPQLHLVFITLFLVFNFLVSHNILGSFLFEKLRVRAYRWSLSGFTSLILILIAFFSVGILAESDLGSGIKQLLIVIPDHETCRILMWPFTLVAHALAAESVTSALPAWIFLFIGNGVFFILATGFKQINEEKTYRKIARREKRLARRSRSVRPGKKSVEVKNGRHWFPPPGAAMRAIYWKNSVTLLRGPTFKIFSGVVLAGLIVWGVLLFMNPGAAQLIGSILLVFGLIFPFMGPGLFRADFRSELGNLELLKTLPLSSRKLMFSQILIASAVTAFFQVIFLTVGVFSLYVRGPMQVESPSLLLWLYACVLVVAPVFTLSCVVVENCLIIWLPAWFYFGGRRVKGVAGMGKGMFSLFIRTLCISLIILVPASISVIGGGFLYVIIGVAAIPLAGLVAALLVVAELIVFGGFFASFIDRLEPGSSELVYPA